MHTDRPYLVVMGSTNTNITHGAVPWLSQDPQINEPILCREAFVTYPGRAVYPIASKGRSTQLRDYPIKSTFPYTR